MTAGAPGPSLPHVTHLATPSFAFMLTAALIAWAVVTFIGGADIDGAEDRLSPKRLAGTGPVQITLVGTSLTASSDWPERLQAHLDACLARPVAVSTVAQPGATSAWGLSAASDVSATEPDIVVIEFAINDADVRIGHPIAESRRNHVDIVEELRTRNPGVVIYLMTTNPALGKMRRRRPLLPAYYRLYRNLANTLDLGLADVRTRWTSRGALRRDLPDGLHPSDDSAREVIVPALAPLMAKTLGATDTQC